MADIYSNLELVNNAVQEAGAGDKRNRNNAIRKGLENPGLYQSGGVQPTSLDQTLSTVGTQPNIASQPSWNAPQQWADYYWDVDRKRSPASSVPSPIVQDASNSSMLNGANAPSSSIMQDAFGRSMLNGAGADTRDLSKEDAYKRINEESKAYRSKGFIPDNPKAQEYLKSQGWNYIPGYNSVGSGHGKNDATPEEGAGVWTKAHPEGAYKGMGMDWVTYSPTRGYGGYQYLKKAPQQHGIGGFLASPAGMFLMAAASALGGAGLGGLFAGSGAATTGLGELGTLGSLGAQGGMSVAPWVGSGIANTLPAMSLVPGGAGAIGVASGAIGSGGLFGNGGVYGSGFDIGKLGNNALESGIKSTITSGGDIKKGITSGLSSALSSGLGGLFNSDVNRYVSSMSRPAFNAALSGGSLQDSVKSALFGGANTGLSSLLNSTDLLSGNTQEKNALANNAISLAQTLSRKRKVA